MVPPLCSTLVTLLSLPLAAGCATGSREGHDAGRRVDAPALFDVRPALDGGGTDGGGVVDPDGGPIVDPDGGPIGVDVGPTGADAGPVDTDAGPMGTDAGPMGTDAGPMGTDAGPIDRCAGVSCAVFDGPCSTGVCNPSTGSCSLVPRADGLGCDDGDVCTSGDSCLSGACRRGTAVDCSGSDTACAMGVCNTATGACTTTPRPDGTTCGGTGCGAGSCMGGTCALTGALDCASCGASMYCAAGACGANPTTLSYGFESGTLPPGWTNGVGGTTGWSVISGGAHGGTFRVRSGAIGASSQSRMSFTITLANAATLSFWLQTSTEATYDLLQVFVDGVAQGTWSGTNAWTQASVGLAAGTRTIEFRYTKDGSINTGMDAVAIDDVTIGAPTSASTDFESASLPAGYTTGGSLPWVSDTTMPHGGARSAASGAISDSQTSSMFRTVSLPSASTLTYWYRVSTESGYDYLRVYIDGAMAGQWSGTVAWTMASHALAAGTHTVEWRYSKDISLSGGSDRVWVDDVDFGFTPTGGPLCGP